MKRLYVLLLAMVLLLSGCTGKGHPMDISVEDVCCPYKLTHREGALTLTLQDGEKQGLTWQTEVIPTDVCELTQEASDEEYTNPYRITGLVEGAAQLTFTAMDNNGEVFVLRVVVQIDADKKVTLSSCEHGERIDNAVEADGLSYQWNVDVNGILHFSLINTEDHWSVRGDGEGICTLSEKLSTPSGCKFSAEAIAAGQTTVSLVGEETGRIIYVTVQADDNGALQITSVQE